MALHFASRQLLTLLKSCNTLTCFQQVHVPIIQTGLHNDLYLITNFLSFFFDKFNNNNNNNNNFNNNNNNNNNNNKISFDYPTSVFNAVVYRDDILCNAYLKGCFAYSSLSWSLSVLSDFRISGFCPDTFTFPLLIKRCSMELSGCVGFGVHGLLIKYGFEDDLYVGLSLIDFYGKFGLLGDAQKLFDEMPVTRRHDILCNAFLKGCFAYSSLSWSLSVLSGFRVSGFCPDMFTFPLLIKRCSMELSGCVGFGVHGLLIKYGFEDDLYVGSSLIDFYGKFRLLGDAKKVFDEMPVRNVVSWTSLVEAYVINGDLGSARRVFDEMPSRNHVSWNVMISGYVKKGGFDEAKRLLDEMARKDVVDDGYAKCGVMTSARVLFNQSSGVV